VVLDAVLAALAGACCYALAGALQHQEAAKIPAAGVIDPRLLLELARRPRWLAGIGATGAGAGLHLFALSEAPLTIVQPVGVTALVFAVPIAAALGPHRIRWQELAAALVMLVGLVALLSVFPAGAGARPGPGGVGALLGFAGASGAALAVLATVLAGRARTVVLAAAAGAAFGATSALARVLLLVLREPSSSLVLLAGTGFVLLAGLGLLLTQSAYRSGSFALVLAVVTIVDPLVAATAGVALFREPAPGGAGPILLAAIGVGLAIVGVTWLASSPAHAPARAGTPAATGTTATRPAAAPQPHRLGGTLSGGPGPRATRHRIVIGADTYPPDVNGAAHFTHQLAAGLAGRGHEVHVLCPSPAGPAPIDVEDGVTVHRVPSRGTPVHPSFRVALPPASTRAAATILADLQPDVVHVQSHFPICRALLEAARRRGVPVAATNHFMPENLLAYGRVPAPVARIVAALAWRDCVRVLERADRVTTPTVIAARLIRDHGLSTVAAPISCGVDLERFTAAGRHRPAGPPGRVAPPTMLFVGRLDAEKHLDEVITALRQVRRHVNARLLLAGQGSQEQQLAALADRLGVADHVRFLGHVPNAALPALYRGADVFVMPGVAELQSLATLEAMACGLPVIAADAMALPHLVHPGINGYLYPPGDTTALAAHATTLLSRANLRQEMGQASRRIAAQHDLTATLEQFETLYASMTDATTRPGTGDPAAPPPTQVPA